MTANETIWVDVAAEADVLDDAMLPCQVGDLHLILVRRGPAVFAYEDLCPHLNYPMSTGGIDGGEMLCFWHGAAFEIETGRVTCGPTDQDLRAFPVRLSAGRVEVAVPAADG